MWKKANNTGKRRRGAEIYFVLYLSALILLLPGKQEKKQHNALEAITTIFEQSFSLLPEKNTLLCKMTSDSVGMPVLQLDTSNILLITGNVQDVALECIVEDQDKGQVVQVGSNPGSNFTIEYDSVKQLVFFSWHPPTSMLTTLNESKTYAVTVKAKAKPLISGNNPELQQLLRASDPTLMTEAKFSISILAEKNGNVPAKIVYTPSEQNLARLIDKLKAQNQFQVPESIKRILDFNMNASTIDPLKNVMIIPLDKEVLSLSPALQKVGAMAMQSWSNRIVVQGILTSENYYAKPTITVEQNTDIPGTASIEEVKSGQLVISGIAPGNAPMKVIVTVQRKSDQRIAITEFEVFPTSFKAAEYPPEIRPGQRVLINPNFTSVPGMEAVTTIVDEFGQILKQIPGGAPFYFDLQNTRNTKFVFLERKINGKIFGDRYRIDIKSSVPEAGRELPKSIGTVVYVKSCGVYDGTKNRCRIVNKEGTSDNIKRPQELYADSEDDNAGCFVQRFQIVPKDPDKPYSVTVFFIDSQDNKSNAVEISYP